MRNTAAVTRAGHAGVTLLSALIFAFCFASPTHASLVAESATPNSVTLSWTAPGDDDHSGTASQYDVRYSTSLITEASWDDATQAGGEPSPQPAGSAEEFTVTGLNTGTTYYFAVKTSDEVPNWSDLSNVVSKATAAEDTSPAAIADLGIGDPTATSLTLTWTAPGDDGNSGTASQYDIRYSTSSITAVNWDGATQVGGESPPQVAGSAEQFVVTGLTPSTKYYFAIKTADEIPNWSDPSNVESGTTSTEATPPAAIANLGTENPTDHSITLTWTAPGDDGNSGTASQYDIRYSSSAITAVNWYGATQTSGEPSPQTGGSLESFEVDNLNSNTTYYFAIKTADEVPNWSAVSNSPAGTTLPDGTPPVAVSELAVILPSLTSLTLVWTAPGDDGNSGTASEYDIRYSTSPITEANWSSASQLDGEPAPQPAGTPETLTVSGLAEGTTYYFALKTGDEIPNWSLMSNVGSNTTVMDATPPAAINDLSAAPGEEDGELDLTWSAPGDDSLLGTAMAYLIRYSQNPISENNWDSAALFGGTPSPLAAGSPQASTVTGLVPGETYYAAARSLDDAANLSALSNVASGTAKFTIVLDNEDLAQPSSPPCNATLPASQPVLVAENANVSLDNVYWFELATDSSFYGLVARGLVNQEPGPTTSWKTPVKLAEEQTYYWRVATNDDGYSAVSSFTVKPFTHAYPNPVRLSEVSGATFTNLPEGANLTVLTVSGSVVRSWDNISGQDIVWDGTNQSGSRVASGTYLWYVTDNGTKGKLIVIN